MFKTPLNLEVIGVQRFKVTKPLVWEDFRQIITVKEEFDFDGASIPKYFWPVIGSPMTGGFQRAACLHDALYASQIFDRKKSDKLFKAAMKMDNVPFITTTALYYGVRLFGFIIWKDITPEELTHYKLLVDIKVKD